MLSGIDAVSNLQKTIQGTSWDRGRPARTGAKRETLFIWTNHALRARWGRDARDPSVRVANFIGSESESSGPGSPQF